jgi:hypothetical protein
VICIRTNVWPQRLHDVEETESVIMQEQKYRQEQTGEAATAQPGAGHKGTGA